MIESIMPIRTLTRKQLSDTLYFEVDSEEYLKLRVELARTKEELKKNVRTLKRIGALAGY